MNQTTEKLYYTDPSCMRFTGTVTAAGTETLGSYIELDRTAFYPEGGGQPCDLGTLGGFPVTFVKDAESGIRHFVTLPEGASLPEAGTVLEGEVDALRRRDMTEQHAGEHMVSGLICRAFSCDNVGFHIGEPFTTIDYNAEITLADLKPLEDEANRLIRADIPVHIFWPSPEELRTLQYRSKKELTGAVRIVEYPGADICACCGTHVERSGQIGLVKFISAVSHRGGTRIEMLSGGRALEYLSAVLAENHKVSVALAAPALETGAALEKLQREMTRQRERIAALETAAVAAKAASLAGKGDVLLREQELSADSTRRLASEVGKTCSGFCGVLSDCGQEGVRYCLCDERGGLRELVKAFNAAFSGRGGGQPGFVQGTAHGDMAAMAAFFTERYPEVSLW